MFALTPFPLFMAVLMAIAPAHAAAEVHLAWSADGFAEPSAVVHDPERDLLYVANVNAEAPNADEASGFISKLGIDGTMLEREWVTGLEAPTALALHGGLLYVADVDRLVAVDVDAGAILENYPAPGAHTLGGLAVDAGGRVYASDLTRNTIYTFDHGAMQPWIVDEALESPSALLAEEERLVVAAWGALTDGLRTDVPGDLKVIDYAKGDIKSLGNSGPVGNLAGVKPGLSGGYLMTDAADGRLLAADAEGHTGTLQDLPPGAAGLEVVPKARLVVIPLRLDNRVVAYRLT